MVAMQSFLFSTVLILALDFIVVLWVNSSSTISDGESQMSGYRLKQTLQQQTPGVINAAEQPKFEVRNAVAATELLVARLQPAV